MKREITVQWQEHTTRRAYFVFDDDEYSLAEILDRLRDRYNDEIWDHLEGTSSEIDGGIDWDSITWNLNSTVGGNPLSIMKDLQ